MPADIITTISKLENYFYMVLSISKYMYMTELLRTVTILLNLY